MIVAFIDRFTDCYIVMLIYYTIITQFVSNKNVYIYSCIYTYIDSCSPINNLYVYIEYFVAWTPRRWCVDICKPVFS